MSSLPELEAQRLYLLGAISESPTEEQERIKDLKQRIIQVLGDYDDGVQCAAMALLLVEMQIKEVQS